MIDLRPPAEWTRRRFLTLWQTRGGGFYALVGLLTFLWWQLEATIAWIARPHLPDLGPGWIAGRLLARIGLDLGWAAVWPLGWLGRFGLFKAAALLVGALAAYKLLRPVVLPLLEAPLSPAPQAPADPLDPLAAPVSSDHDSPPASP